MIRVLAHAHSTWSHDGCIALSAYPGLAHGLGAVVVLLSEHEESGWDAARYDAYVQACDTLSTRDVRLVPGLEFRQEGHHLLCYGLRALPLRPSSIDRLADDVHRDGCLLVLAHPGKYHWRIPPALLHAVDAVEIWNSKWIYDGAAGPHPASLRLATGKLDLFGQDVHKPKHLSSLLLLIEGDDPIEALARGRYGVEWHGQALMDGEWRERDAVARAGARLHRVGMDVALAGHRAAGRLWHPSGATSHADRLRVSRTGWAPTDTPAVSVVLPIRNEAAYIERALRSVLAQDYPADRLEVLVADGRSTDRTRDIVLALARAAERHPPDAAASPHVSLIDNPGAIVPTGLNAALAVASGDVIVRVDGHCEVPPDFVRRAVAHLVLDDVDCVGGLLDTIGDTPEAQVIAAAMSASFGVGGSAFRSGAAISTLTDTVAFPAFTRQALTRAGRFDEELVRNQDDEYSYRLRRAGGRILLATDMRARYYSRGTRRSLWRQCLQYGLYKVRVLQKHPRQMRARQFVPALFVVSLVLSAALASFWRASWPLFALVLGAYVAAALIASGREARRRGAWRWLVALPPVFATMHVAYGVGFLLGLVAFLRRWRTVGQPADWPARHTQAGGRHVSSSSIFPSRHP